ncbi:hypothetical protein [Actinacidiphila yeochonensis]|uniref:hypothetical protein n=1 Tax=Actinacidiphila yeochonensis TaxID=89050 RepID=UPI0006906AE8|nr:hypothetical protein [Actinacidiphila yeochonensis]
MADTLARTSLPTTPTEHRTPPAPAAVFQGRISADPDRGFYPAPGRYHLYLAPCCPRSLRVAVTLGLLGLDDCVGTTLLGGAADPSASPGLRAAYEAARHHYDSPLTVPALCDRWSGRVVSNHTPHILDDLALRFSDPADPARPQLRPAALAADIDALRELVEDGTVEPLLLDLLDCRLANRRHVLGAALTAADVDVWAALARPPAHRGGDGDPLAGRPHLAAWWERLGAEPAFAAAR